MDHYLKQLSLDLVVINGYDHEHLQARRLSGRDTHLSQLSRSNISPP